MKLSVLIPICNKEKPEHLKQSIESIVNQTKKAEQIVIVKDGELSGELNKIIEEYKNQYTEMIDILELRKQKSLGRVLNAGIKICKHEYIARMDSDDISRKDRFEKQIGYLEKNPDIDILGGYIQEYNENMQKAKSIRKVPLVQDEIYKGIVNQSPFNHSTVIIKKESLVKIGCYKDCQLEDYDLWIRMRLNNMRMANLSEVLIDYRTSIDMYKRRTGFKYLKGVINIEKVLIDNKLINKNKYMQNILLRTILAFIPARIKLFLYPKIVRKIKWKN